MYFGSSSKKGFDKYNWPFWKIIIVIFYCLLFLELSYHRISPINYSEWLPINFDGLKNQLHQIVLSIKMWHEFQTTFDSIKYFSPQKYFLHSQLTIEVVICWSYLHFNLSVQSAQIKIFYLKQNNHQWRSNKYLRAIASK